MRALKRPILDLLENFSCRIGHTVDYKDATFYSMFDQNLDGKKLLKQGLANGPFRTNMSDGRVCIGTMKDNLKHGLTLLVDQTEISAIISRDDESVFILQFDRAGNELIRDGDEM